MADRDYDVVLLGATGFTGRLVARHLDRRVAGAGTRWAVAGRDAAKLGALVSDLSSAPAVEVVDVGDDPAVVDLARRTRVLATTVGPFARYGEPVVRACVEAATDYCDITGEPGFVAMVRERYGAAAERAGSRLVHACGFDSVPHDLGAQFTVEQLPSDVPIRIRAYVQVDARASGSTAITALDIAASASPSNLRGSDRRSTDRRVGGLPLRIHRVAPLGAWGVPLPTIDPLIVLRSAATLDRYGPDFRYGHYVELPNLPAALAGVGVFAGAALLARIPPARALLERLLPDAGDGPSEDVRARSRFRVTFLAEGGGQRVTTRVAGGDPGYDETAVMLGEAALALAHDDLPAVVGQSTTAVALGVAYRDRLIDQGLRFEVLEALPAAS